MVDGLLIENCRIEAAKSVCDPDNEYVLRQIARWYSKNFYTPLHLVDDLDPVIILTAFYETTFAGFDEERLHEEIMEIVESPEDKLKSLLDEAKREMEDDNFGKSMEETIKKTLLEVAAASANKASPFATAPTNPSGPVALKDKLVPDSLEVGLEGLTGTGKARPDLVAKMPAKLPEDVQIRFMTEEQMEAAANEDMVIQPIKPPHKPRLK